MIIEELTKYKSDFKRIVWLKGEIANHKNHIRDLTAWDKNDSHKKAIVKAIVELNKLRQEFIDKLNGIDYFHMMKSLQKATMLSKRKNRDAFNNFNPF